MDLIQSIDYFVFLCYVLLRKISKLLIFCLQIGKIYIGMGACSSVVEQGPFKPRVEGSIPSRPSIKKSPQRGGFLMDRWGSKAAGAAGAEARPEEISAEIY